LDGNDLSPEGKVPFLSPFAYPLVRFSLRHGYL
jgi:hypothetical protein